MNSIKKYYDSVGNVMAIVIPSNYENQGICFVTDDGDFQQVATMSHNEGHVILPHYHNKIERVVEYTTETLFVKSGRLHVCLYENKKPLHEFQIAKGDIIILLRGGHGFKVLEAVSMIEVKQGPFLGEIDKTRF